MSGTCRHICTKIAMLGLTFCYKQGQNGEAQHPSIASIVTSTGLGDDSIQEIFEETEKVPSVMDQRHLCTISPVV